MLTHLVIRNFVIVEHLELEFAPGMTALTGETGAGKSILLDALGVLLGDRADSSAVRPPAERAEVTATFDLSDLPAAQDWLQERALDSDGDCQLRRVISTQGRSRAFVNGSPQPLAILRELGEYLVDIHGQHEHQSLIKSGHQRQLLDGFADAQPLLDQVSAHYRTIQRLGRELAELERLDAERDARLDLLRFQTQELHTLGLQDGELSALEEEQPRLANAERLLSSCQQGLGVLYENDESSIHSLLGQVRSDLDELTTVDERLRSTVDLLSNALIQVEEASDELRSYLQSVELDPARLQWVEQRLADIDRMARKHRTAPDTLITLLHSLNEEQERLENSEGHREDLRTQQDKAEQAYHHVAKTLRQRRQKAAKQLAEQITTIIRDLGMPKGKLAVALAPLERPTAHGLDEVELLVSANPGQPPQPLSKVASGGELSRISLAIQVVFSQSLRIPTLIFDEVDSGIGGGVAEVVGRQLRHLGQGHQVFCVTHLPQVAAQAHRHFQISKHTDDQHTWTSVTPLSSDERVQEIARMLGGLAVTDNTLAHAQEMIDYAARD